MDNLFQRTEGFIQLIHIEDYLMAEWNKCATNNEPFNNWDAYFEAIQLVGRIRVNF